MYESTSIWHNSLITIANKLFLSKSSFIRIAVLLALKTAITILNTIA